MIIRKIKKVKNFFRKIRWVFLNINEQTVDLIKINSLSFKPIVLHDKKNYEYSLKNLNAGRYCIRVAHRNEKLFNLRKGLIIAFNLSEVRGLENKKNQLGLNKYSKKYGVFEYLGGGVKKEELYIQDMYLDVKNNIKLLKIKLQSLMSDELVYIESFQFFDVFVPEKSITTLKNSISEVPSDISETKDSLLYLEQLVQDKSLSNINILLYADVTPNVIDGSSIWLTSVINILSVDHNVLVLFKDNINKDKNVISNIISYNYKYIEPKDLGISGPLNNELAVNLLQGLDKVIPSIQAVVTRGYDLALTLQKDDSFIGRRFTYLTDFYTISDHGLVVPDHRKKTLRTVISNADFLLIQTEQIKKKLEELTQIKSKTLSLPPTLPKKLEEHLTNPDIPLNKDVVNIGYAGKVQPNWGVEELIDWSNKLRSTGVKIHLHIATGKIYSSNRQDGFVRKMNQMLKGENVTLYTGLDRFKAMSLMNEMDFVWCYRAPLLEKSTLEVSTKLIEMAALAKSSICYPSTINKDLLGSDYPCFIESFNDYEKLIINKYSSSFDFKSLSTDIKNKHSFERVAQNFSFLKKIKNTSKRKIVVAGHDLKFINPWISFLKQEGYQVKVDVWEWGKAIDLKRSEKLLQWADVIFCEWGLANAVWYSQNNVTKKPLYIRAHAQEVRDRARKFGQQIDINNVTQVIFVAEHIKKKALELWKWPEAKTVHIPNFLLTNKFALKKTPIKLNLGMVGIIPQTKRFDRAVELLEKLVSEGKDAHLHIKGHRPEELEFMRAPGRKKELEYYDNLYKKIADSDELKSRVHFDGWGNDVSEWYQKIDFILSPSDAESFHYALADGVLSGCIPIVWGWEFSDTIYPSTWIVENYQEAIDRIKLFLNLNDDKISKLREASRKHLEEKYSSNIVFDKIHSVIFK